jgi:hypothetical protein
MFRCSRCSRPNARCERSRSTPTLRTELSPQGQSANLTETSVVNSGLWTTSMSCGWNIGVARFHPGFPPTDGLRPQDAVAFLHQTTRILDPHLRGVG